MTQARADNAGHDGLRAWTRGLQTLIAYWSGRLADSVSYARRGAESAERSRGTSAVWLAASRARALAAQGDAAAAHAAVDRAAEARDAVAGDELDELGGLCTFSRARELYYAADALAWSGAAEAQRAEALATEALDAYATAPEVERAFGDQAGARCALATSRVSRGEVDGAAEPKLWPLELEGHKTVLRELVAEDVDAVAAIIGDERVTQFLSFDSRTREQAAGMISGVIERAQAEPRTEFYLAVTSHDGDLGLLGFARLALTGHQAGKLGYAIGYEHQGKGYATDAVTTMVDYGFQTLGLHRITAAIGPDNPASIAVAERLGFTREGVLREHVFTNGSWRDSMLFSVLEHEWVRPSTYG